MRSIFYGLLTLALAIQVTARPIIISRQDDLAAQEALFNEEWEAQEALEEQYAAQEFAQEEDDAAWKAASALASDKIQK
jgi:hypothetical protein